MVLAETLLLLVSPLFSLFLFSYVFGQRRKNRLNSAFLTLFAICFLESLCDFLFRVTDLLILRTILLATTTSLFFLTSVTFLNFVYALINKKHDFTYILFGIMGTISALIPLLNISLNTSPVDNEGIYTPLPNVIFAIVFIVYFCPVTIYGVALSIHHAIVTPDRVIRKQIIIWTSGIILSFLYVTLISFILPEFFKITIFSTFGSLSLIITDIFSFWLVRKHNFMTVNISQLEEILDKVFAEAGEAILLIDRNQHIVRANNTAITLFKLDQQLIGEISLASLIPDLTINNTKNTFETTIHTAGTQHSIFVSVTALKASDETVQKIVTIRDITRMKQAEEEMFRKQQLESLGLLAGGIAHDFNNLLCGIVSSISFAQMNVGADSETAKILQEGENAALSARSLTQQLLTFAKGGEPVTTVFNPIEVLKEVSVFSSRGAKTRLEFELPVENISILADEGQIRQVFQNIVINACQAMPNGGLITIKGICIDLSGNQLPPLKAGHYLRVSISDEGTGISPSIISRIFEPYFTTKQKGNGIGLAVVYRILTRHQGHITVESELGKGTTFTIYLPIFCEESNPTVPALRVSPKKQTTMGRVLIMDDDAIIRRTLLALLQQLGYVVDTSKNGEEALEKFDQSINQGLSYSLVIIDLMVSEGMGGVKLAQEIALRNNSVPIIISSGYSDDLGLIGIEDISISGYLRKPYSLKELKAMLEIIQ